MTITIEKNVPIPARRRPGSSTYPFADMEPCDSFHVAMDSDEKITKAVTSIPASGVAFFKRRGVKCKFTARPEVHEGRNGVRVWRTA